MVLSSAGTNVAVAAEVPPDTMGWYSTVYRQWDFTADERNSIWATDPYLVKSNGVNVEVNPRHGNNVRIMSLGDGNTAVQIVTRRHCTTTMTEALVWSGDATSNEHAGKCPSGYYTRYSTGRLTSSVSTAYGGDFLFVARVKVDSGSPDGLRAAVWMNTANFDINPPASGYNRAYCDAGAPVTNLAEMDVLEWYGGTLANKPSMVNHVGCDIPSVPLKTRRAGTYLSQSGWAGAWHYVAVASDGTRIRNYYDADYSGAGTLLKMGPIGNQYGYSTANWTGGYVPTLAQWNETMQTGPKFQMIISADVAGAASQPFSGLTAKAVDNNATFPATAITVDYAKVYVH